MVYEIIKAKSTLEIQLANIVLTDELGSLHPFFGQLFHLLENKGIEITLNPSISALTHDDNLCTINKLISGEGVKCDLSVLDKKSFQIMHFRNDLEACEFFASQNILLKEATIINSDNNSFDDLQSAFGLPLSGSVFQKANPQTIQLFKLSSALFLKPLNIQNLLSYFQLAVHPVPGKLRMNLLNVISSEGGVENKKWQEVIANYVFDSDKKKAEILNFLEIRQYKTNEIDKQDLLQFYNSLNDWANKRRIAMMEEDPSVAIQLSHLRILCKNMLSLVNDISKPQLSATEFIQIIKDTYEPMDISGIQAQRGSVSIVGLAGQIHSRVETLIWMDFYGSNFKPHYYSFLNNTEITNLTAQGALLWDAAAQAQSNMQQFKNAVLKTSKRCILVTCDKVKDEITEEHPLHSLLKAGVKNLNEFIINFEELSQSQNFTEFGFETPEYKEIENRALPQRQTEFHINQGLLIGKRVIESVSSIEQMLQFPFDWVLQYAAGIKSANSYQMEDITITLGNVAHQFVEQIFNDANFSIIQAKVLLEDFDARIYQCIRERGAVLLLDEHRFECERFVARLKKSTTTLITLIEENRLTVVSPEFEVNGSAGILDKQNFTGYIDLLLKDELGQLVIMDLKWTFSDKKYKVKVKEGKSVQLSIYKALICEKDKNVVSKTAYFLLSSGILISSYEFKGAQVFKIDSKSSEEEILQKIENSIEYRRKQFGEGIIEEGEEGPLAQILYFNDQEENSLIQLESDSSGKNKKKNYYSSFNVLKGNIS